MPQLLRDNAADARVAADVERLAGAYNKEAVAAAATSVAEARAADLALLATTYERTPDAVAAEPWWRPALVHLNRYRTLYVAAALVLGVVVLRSPAPLPTGQGTDEATASLPTGDNAAASTPTQAPIEAFPTPAGQLPVTPAVDLASPFEPIAPVAVPTASTPLSLRISQSGYASTFAGTPLEQPPPSNGLPVETIAGSTTRLSFVRLTGAGKSLRLNMVTDSGANTNDATAAVWACHITTGNWTATRGAPMNQAPKYDANDCVLGARQGNAWTFRFVLDDPLDRNGWALVPVTSGNATFQVVFSPNPA